VSGAGEPLAFGGLFCGAALAKEIGCGAAALGERAFARADFPKRGHGGDAGGEGEEPRLALDAFFVLLDARTDFGRAEKIEHSWNPDLERTSDLDKRDALQVEGEESCFIAGRRDLDGSGFVSFHDFKNTVFDWYSKLKNGFCLVFPLCPALVRS